MDERRAARRRFRGRRARLGGQRAQVGRAGRCADGRCARSAEAAVDESWKRRIATASPEDAIKVEFADDVFPPSPADGYAVKPRVLSTSFVDEWNERLDEAHRDPDPLRAELGDAIEGGRVHELLPFTGQSAGLIEDVLPAGEIVRRLVAEAEDLLRAAPTLAS